MKGEVLCLVFGLALAEAADLENHGMVTLPTALAVYARQIWTNSDKFGDSCSPKDKGLK